MRERGCNSFKESLSKKFLSWKSSTCSEKSAGMFTLLCKPNWLVIHTRTDRQTTGYPPCACSLSMLHSYIIPRKEITITKTKQKTGIEPATFMLEFNLAIGKVMPMLVWLLFAKSSCGLCEGMNQKSNQMKLLCAHITQKLLFFLITTSFVTRSDQEKKAHTSEN